jgi:predicted RNA methylase
MWLHAIQTYLDGSLDRKFGTDTSGRIPLERLTIESGNAREGVWYEPMSENIFAQIMNNLNINWGEFNFIDFGSGKGRVLLLASNYGFKNVIGIEFSKELHQIATENVALWDQSTGRRSNIVPVYMDATEYAIPNEPLVVFLYSPFMGKTMARVLENFVASFNETPRQIVIVFYGMNPETIDLLKNMNFHGRELNIHADWLQFNKYRAFIFTALPTRERMNDNSRCSIPRPSPDAPRWASSGSLSGSLTPKQSPADVAESATPSGRRLGRRPDTSPQNR